MVTSIKGNATSTFGGQVVIPAPAFSAYLSSNQSYSANTWTKVTVDTEDFDTTSDYDNSTNYRFQPSVAGYYQINGKIGAEGSSGTITRVLIGLFKNGSEFKLGSDIWDASIANTASTLNTLVYLNGSTDYVELYTYSAGGTPLARGYFSHTYFQGFLARAV